ncbi:hypothetical protein LBMAG07_10140 [Actinomycetes bacterium]|nr:hypothetical protein LBMAG07_10140 [Actinomycetes bacterium]
MSSSVNVSGTGPPNVVLPGVDSSMHAALDAALGSPERDRRDAVARVVARYPRYLAAWAALGDVARDTVESYMAYRVGYHRGLDALRQNGWKGNGYVRWSAVSNHGFLNCLDGLARTAALIGETDEATRCAQFLLQCDPTGKP